MKVYFIDFLKLARESRKAFIGFDVEVVFFQSVCQFA